MNNIDSKVTASDRANAKIRRKSASAYAEDILKSLRDACPFSTTFLHGIPVDSRLVVQAELQKQFEIWANTWIAPICRQIIAKQKQ